MPSPKSATPARSDMPIIGWREWVALPDLGIDLIKVKVDTGARSSSLHAFELEPFQRRGRQWVRFLVHPQQRSREVEVEVEVPVLEYRSVRSSDGKASQRPVILTPITLLGETWPVELTLASRDEMGFRMLLGREAVRRRFLVDAGLSYLGGRPSGARPKTKKTRTKKTQTKKTQTKKTQTKKTQTKPTAK